MNDGTTDTMHVTFPATERFLRLGRVAMAGLALRLQVEVHRVEQLRIAVDEATESLAGDGSIDLLASWQPGRLQLIVSNPHTELGPVRRRQLADTLLELVDEAEVGASAVTLVLADAA